MRKTLIALFAVPALAGFAFAAAPNTVTATATQTVTVKMAPYISLTLAPSTAIDFDFVSGAAGNAYDSLSVASLANFKTWSDGSDGTSSKDFAPTGATALAPLLVTIKGNTKTWNLVVTAAVGTLGVTAVNTLRDGLQIQLVRGTTTVPYANPISAPTTLTVSAANRDKVHNPATDVVSVFYKLNLSPTAVYDFTNNAFVADNAVVTYTVTGL